VDGHAFFFSSRRRHTSFSRDWSSDVLLFRSAVRGPLPDEHLRLRASAHRRRVRARVRHGLRHRRLPHRRRRRDALARADLPRRAAGRARTGAGRAHGHQAEAGGSALAGPRRNGRSGRMSMEFLLASAIGTLTAAGVYMTLRARTFPVIIGLALLSYAV